MNLKPSVIVWSPSCRRPASTWCGDGDCGDGGDGGGDGGDGDGGDGGDGGGVFSTACVEWPWYEEARTGSMHDVTVRVPVYGHLELTKE